MTVAIIADSGDISENEKIRIPGGTPEGKNKAKVLTPLCR